jgi:predicted RNase H-like HicB family nuclease
MAISFFVLIIEKTEGVYLGYTPNVSGVLSTGNTREEVERSLLLQIEEHLEEMGSRHTTSLEVTTRPVERRWTAWKLSEQDTGMRGHVRLRRGRRACAGNTGSCAMATLFAVPPAVGDANCVMRGT